MSRSPLDDEFDIESSVFNEENDEYTIKIPEEKEERDLDMVIEFAVKQYKMNYEDQHLMSPTGKLKVMEINERLLNTIKDATYKKEYIKVLKERLRLSEKSKRGSGSKVESSSTEEGKSEGISRNELAEKVRKLKAVK